MEARLLDELPVEIQTVGGAHRQPRTPLPMEVVPRHGCTGYLCTSVCGHTLCVYVCVFLCECICVRVCVPSGC